MMKAMNKQIYSNYCMYSPDNILMCYISKKKADWYLKRNIARIIADNSIQLIFKPNGLGRYNDPYYTQSLMDQCVVCGDKNLLTKHHIIPYCFRRYFPNIYKDHMSHDVLLLCTKCHEKYETSIMAYKLNLVKSCETEERKKFNRIFKDARALYLYADKMPEEKKEQIAQELKDYYSDNEILNKIEDIVNNDAPNINNDWERYVNTIRNIEEFIVMWRKNFIDTMQPKFLPKYWNLYDRTQLSNAKI